MKNKLHCLGLIPARIGSKRVPKKNIKILGGHPLLAYTISAALQSGIFSRVIVSTENEEVAEIAKKYGAEVPFLRPAEFAGDRSPDIEWVKHLLIELKKNGDTSECFSILRPTSPFRLPKTIKKAWQQFIDDGRADSLRAVEKCTQHPGKMWKVDGTRMTPILKNPDKTASPWYSMPYQLLPPIYVQNASLEISWCRIPLEKDTIAGDNIMPFISEGYEGFDINNPEDWIVAEYLVNNKLAKLPEVNI